MTIFYSDAFPAGPVVRMVLSATTAHLKHSAFTFQRSIPLLRDFLSRCHKEAEPPCPIGFPFLVALRILQTPAFVRFGMRHSFRIARPSLVGICVEVCPRHLMLFICTIVTVRA